MRREHARSLRGERVIGTRPGRSWKTVSLIGAIRLGERPKIMASEIAVGGRTFLRFVRQRLASWLYPGDIVIMDNLNVHKMHVVREAIRNTGSLPVYLPTYSPELNPIELLWTDMTRRLPSLSISAHSDLLRAARRMRASTPIAKIEACFVITYTRLRSSDLIGNRMPRVRMTTSTDLRIAAHRSTARVTIVIRPKVGTGEWTVMVALAFPLLATFIDRIFFTVTNTELSWHTVGLVVALILSFLFLAGILRMIAAVIWRRFGLEELVIGQDDLILNRVLGPVHCQRKFTLVEVGNIRWRERRVVAKGTSYFRRVVSFDVTRDTIDIGTQLSFDEAIELERELRTAIDTVRRPE